MAKTHRLDHQGFIVPPGKTIRLKDYNPGDTGGIRDKAAAKDALLEDVSDLADMQDVFWASKSHAMVIIFQALDAAGKDSTIEHVMSGVNPQGVNVFSFKAPTEDERLHHFLWRPIRVLPPAGMIAIFNRSYYEEVLVVRVHPEFLDSQPLTADTRKKGLENVWQTRYDNINAFERTLVKENTHLVKFFLNVSRNEQRKRFLQRLENPEKHWKFSVNDLAERKHWDDYQTAYEEMLSATSTEWAPWYVIPADRKWFMRAAVADVITARLRALDVRYPVVPEKNLAELAEAKRQLQAEKDS